MLFFIRVCLFFKYIRVFIGRLSGKIKFVVLEFFLYIRVIVFLLILKIGLLELFLVVVRLIKK